MTLIARPKILHAYKSYPPEETGGGISAIIFVLTKVLRWPSEIIVARRRGRATADDIDGIRVYRAATLGYLWSMPLAPLYPLLLWRRMRGANIVDYHFPFPLVDLALALWLPRRIAFIVHWHSDIVAQKKLLPYIGWLFRRTLRRADRIVVSSQAIIDNSPFLRLVAEKCAVIPFGVDLAYWSALDETERQRVEELRRRHSRFVLAVGRLVPYKHFDVLIDAMAKVDGRLIIAGTGPLRNRLDAQIKMLGLSDRVYLADYVDLSEMKCLYHACDVFVLPSGTPNETFGVVQLQAMATAKPVVNTRLPTGVPWVARDGQEALTVTPGSVDELAVAITRLLDDPALAYRLGEQGRRRAAEHFSLDQFTKRTAEVYCSAVTGKMPELATSKYLRDGF